MSYSIVRSDTLCAVESPTAHQIRLIDRPVSPDSEEWHQQQAYFAYLKDRRYWIQCKCNGEALIYIGRSPNYLFLYSRQGSQRKDHADHCPFRFSERNGSPGTLKSLKDDDYSFFTETNATPTKSEKTSSNSTSRVPESKLFALLRHIAKDAGLHTVHNGQKSDYKTQREGFLAGAACRTLGGVPLDQLVFIDLHYTRSAREKMFSTQFAKKHLPTSLFIWIADSYQVDNDTVSFQFGRGRDFSLKECRTHLHHARGSQEDGPFLIAALYRYGPDKDGKRRFTFPTAYIIPIVSKVCWMFVDSRYEREMAKNLLGRAAYFHQQDGTQSVVHKPLEPLAGMDKEQVIPDFDVTIADRRFFVEVMGYQTWDYIERKQRTVPLMEKVAPVWEFKAYENSDAEKRQHAMFRYCLKLFYQAKQ